MKNKDGYTIIELIILIAILGVATLITVTSLSYAFDDGSKEIKENEMAYILKKAKDYGIDNLADVKDSKDGLTITVNKLVEKKYLASDENGNVTDSTNEKNILNDLKIKITYDGTNEKVNAVVIE